jgi:hypothetical protein
MLAISTRSFLSILSAIKIGTNPSATKPILFKILIEIDSWSEKPCLIYSRTVTMMHLLDKYKEPYIDKKYDLEQYLCTPKYLQIELFQSINSFVLYLNSAIPNDKRSKFIS